MLTPSHTLTSVQQVAEATVLTDITNTPNDGIIDFKLTTKTLRNIYSAVNTDVIPFIEKHMVEYDITTKRRMSAFIASCILLSCGLRRGAETIKMSPGDLTRAYPDKISNISMAKKMVRCGEREVANVIYSYTDGNGGINSDDGWMYRARTPLQFRGRYLYTIVATRSGLDCLNYPELLDDLENSIIAAMAIWEHYNYNAIVDKIRFTTTHELYTNSTSQNTKNYRTNGYVVKLRKKLDGNTTNLINFCNYIETGMLYL
jgi:putative chitinase